MGGDRPVSGEGGKNRSGAEFKFKNFAKSARAVWNVEPPILRTVIHVTSGF
jgi:hypothetical protein